jgi:hypothetical protein
MVRIKPNSAKITITRRPGVLADTANLTLATFANTAVQATGEVTLLGNPGESAAGWRLGYIQAEWVETNWVYYRGLSNADGSLFINRARAPSRTQRATRDTLDNSTAGAGSTVNLVFYDGQNQIGGVADGTAAAVFPLTLNVAHRDTPNLRVRMQETNELTGATNYLREAQFEFMFVTVLSLRDPAGAFHHLAAFYWNVRHQSRFSPQLTAGALTGFSARPTAGGTGSGISHVIMGTPSDHRFTGVLTSNQPGSSNEIFRNAMTRATALGSANRHAARVWQTFDVRRG